MLNKTSTIVAEQSCEFCGEFFPLRAERNLHKCPFFSPPPPALPHSVCSEQQRSCANDAGNSSSKAIYPSLVKPSNYKLSLKAGQIDLKPNYECEFCLSTVKQQFSNLAELNLHYDKFHSVSHKELIKKRKFLSRRINGIQSDNSSNSISTNSSYSEGYLHCTKCQKFFKNATECRQHVIDVHIPSTERSNKLSISELQEIVNKEQQVSVDIGNGIEHDCTECNERFHEKSHFFEHMMTVHRRSILYECSICNKIFPQRLALTRHMQSHKEVDETVLTSQVFECEFCCKQFAYESHYKRHLATHVGTAIFTCDICGDDLRSQSRLVLHKAGHLGDERFRCPKCNKQFAYKSMLERHIRTHAGDLRPCEYCGKMFAIQSLLEKHISLMHMEANQQLSCPHCHKRFLYPSYLERHLVTHSSLKEHACPMCSRTFSQRSTLLTHLQSHLPSFLETQKPYSCPVNFCGRSFKRESTLQKHLESVHCIDRSTVSAVMTMPSAVGEAEMSSSTDHEPVIENVQKSVGQSSSEVYIQEEDGTFRHVDVQRVRAEDGQEYFAIPVTLNEVADHNFETVGENSNFV